MRHVARLVLFVAVLPFSCGKVTATSDAGSDIDAADVVDGNVSNPDATPPAPTATTIDPDWGSMAGGATVTITGSGFTGAGAVSVTFGDTAATAVTVVGDTELTAVVPAGPHSPVDVTVTTGGGSDGTDRQFRYLAPLYSAPSMQKNGGSLYTIDPANAAGTPVGVLASSLTGLALSPDGILFGVTGVPSGGTDYTMQKLVVLNPYDATATDVGLLRDVNAASYYVADITFEGPRLLGWIETASTAASDVLVAIDPATGTVTPVNGPTTGSSGTGLAGRGAGALIANLDGTHLHTVDPVSGVATVGPTKSLGGSVNGLTFLGTQLYGCMKAGGGKLALLPGVALNNSQLVTIDAGTGEVTILGFLPDNTDALAGIPEFVAASPAPPAAPVAPAVTRATAAPAPAPAQLTISHRGHVLAAPTADQLGALAESQVTRLGGSGRVRTVLPLAALAARVPRARTIEIATATDSARISLADARARGLSLTANQRGELKLIDGQGHKLGQGIVTVRIVD